MTDHLRAFPHVLTRIGGLAADVLDGLCLKSALVAAADVESRERDLAGVADEAADALYELVPRLEDRKLRACAIRLRRDIHNAREPDVSAQDFQRLLGCLHGDRAESLRSWMDTHGRLREARSAATRLLDEELAAVAEHVHAVVREPAFEQGVALASSSLWNELYDDRGADLVRNERLRRSTIAYFVRSAAKTTPFSSLTTLRLDGLGAPVGAPSDFRRSAVLVQAAAHELLRACAGHPDLAPALRYCSNDSVRHTIFEGWPRQFVLVPMYQHIDEEFFWRRDDVIDAQLYDDLVQAVSGLPQGSYDDYMARLPVAAHELFTRLLDMAFVVPQSPWSVDDQRPLNTLAATLRGLANELARDVADALCSIDAAVQRLGGSDGRGRVHLLAEARVLTSSTLSSLGRIPAPWLAERGLVYEDVLSLLPETPLPPPVIDDLASLASLARGHLFRGHLADEIRRLFLDRFGPGGVCHDVLDFIMTITVGPDAISRFQTTAMLDQAVMTPVPTERAAVASGAGTAGPTALFMFQLAAESGDAVRRGDYLLAVNSVTAGHVGIFSRYREMMTGTPLQGALRSWLNESFSGCGVFELPVALDVNNLQRQASGLLPLLRWPVETTAPGPDAPALDDLQLRHLADEDRLVFTGADGSPVALIYCGVVPPSLISGPVRQLMTITDPWVMHFPQGDRPSDTPLPGQVPDAMVVAPRRTLGRVVVERAHWKMPAAMFPVRSPRESPLGHIRRLHHWRRSHDIPDEVFVRIERRRRGFSRNPKPLWVDFTAPDTLSAVDRLIDQDAATVILSEALPSRHQHWQRDTPGGRRVTEHVVLMRWDRERDLR